MSAYFDKAMLALGEITEADDHDFEALRKWEDRIVYDCTVCVMAPPGLSKRFRNMVHECVIRHGRYAIGKTPESWFDFCVTMGKLGSDLHGIFHSIAREGLDYYWDDPLGPIRRLHAAGEEERDAIQKAGL